MSDVVRATRTDGLLRVTLNRPAARNALSAEMLSLLRDAFKQAAADAEVRIVLLAGEGQDFCAGADIGEMQALGSASAEENRADADRLAATFAAIHGCPRPVVARVHGNVFGGGNGLVAACDVAICTADACFAFSEVRLGIVPAVISPYVARRIGDTWMRRLFLTGERFDGTRAAAIGLCSAAVDADGLEAAVDTVIGDLRRGGPDAQRRIKSLLEEIAGRTPGEVRGRTATYIADARASEDGQEGLRAYADKRRPSWAPDEEGS